ncbi:MAG: ketopantoate reductase C-terminal domain-containing protein [Caldilineaceae bacterium]
MLDLAPDQIFADKHLANLEIDAWREALAVMRARDIPALNVGSFPFATLAPLIRFGPKPMLRTALRRQVGGMARRADALSLHMDLHSGKGKSEVGWLNGAVVRTGEEAGVATPVNRVLTEVLTELVRAPSQMAAWRHNGERLLANVRS